MVRGLLFGNELEVAKPVPDAATSRDFEDMFGHLFGGVGDSHCPRRPRRQVRRCASGHITGQPNCGLVQTRQNSVLLHITLQITLQLLQREPLLNQPGMPYVDQGPLFMYSENGGGHGPWLVIQSHEWNPKSCVCDVKSKKDGN